MTQIRAYGCIPDIGDFRDRTFKVPRKIAHLPTSLDLRPKDWGIADQGQLGSCVGHGVSGAFRNALIHEGKSDWVASRLATYYFARQLEGTTKEDAGAQIRDGMKGVNKYGLPGEDLWPYDTSKFAVQPSVAAIAEGKPYKGMQYVSVANSNWDAVRAALFNNGNLALGISVYESFESDHVAKTGKVPMPAATESLLGGHCIRAVGFTASALICANSWGTEWGISGYFLLPKKYVMSDDLTNDCWSWTSV